MGNCLELLLHPDRSSGGSRWWWAAPVTPPPPSKWSDLAPEVAGKVLRRLPAGSVDHVRFAAVCTQWRSTARQASLPPPLPLLALPEGAAYSLLDRKPFPFPRCAGYAGVCGDWLVFSCNSDDGAAQQLVAVDPFSDATMTLPALSRVRVWHDDPSFARMETHDSKEMILRRLICCSPHLIAAHVRLGDRCTGIAVCQPGAASWWSVHLDERFSGFDDYTFHQGNLYAVDYPGGGLFSIDIDHSTGDPWVSRIREVIGGATDTTVRGDEYLGEMLYLVESSGGGLLMVRRVINGRWTPPRSENTAVHDAARRNEFQVFEADLERSRWTEAATIGDDQVLFLRQCCSKSVCVSRCEMMHGDRIFFLENVDEDQTWYSKESPSGCSVYDMREGCATMALPVEVSWRPGTVATWLFPKDSTVAVAMVEG